MLKQIQSPPLTSLQHSLLAGEVEVSGEDQHEEPPIRDLGQEDVVESSADCAKPRGAHEESLQTTMFKIAPVGQGKMWRISG